MVSTNLERKPTAHRAKSRPNRKVYRVRKRRRKSGSPLLDSRSTTQPARPASSSSRPMVRRRVVKRTVCSSSHSMPQKSTPSWAHRLTSRSGKGPVSLSTTIPRR